MSIEKNIEEFENSVQSFLSNIFQSSYIENDNFSDNESSDTLSSNDNTLSPEEYGLKYQNHFIVDDHNYPLSDNFIVCSKKINNKTIDNNKVKYRIPDQEYDYTKKCYPTLDLNESNDSIHSNNTDDSNDKIKKNEIINNKVLNNNILDSLMNKEQKQKLLTDLKNICHRLNVVSNVKPHDKLWIDESDDNVRFEIDNTYWLKSFTQPLYRTWCGQGRVKIINQIVMDTNYLGKIYPKLNENKQSIVKKIIEREQQDDVPAGTIAGLENMKQMYADHKDKINQIIAKLRSIITQDNDDIVLDIINNDKNDDKEETDDDLVKTLEKELN